jgi:predicted DNA-binding transcriptional regulator AlpA
MTEPELAGMRDTCAILDCSRDTIERKLRDLGSDFPKPFVIRRKRYWRRADIHAWIAAKAITAVVHARTVDQPSLASSSAAISRRKTPNPLKRVVIDPKAPRKRRCGGLSSRI